MRRVLALVSLLVACSGRAPQVTPTVPSAVSVTSVTSATAPAPEPLPARFPIARTALVANLLVDSNSDFRSSRRLDGGRRLIATGRAVYVIDPAGAVERLIPYGRLPRHGLLRMDADGRHATVSGGRVDLAAGTFAESARAYFDCDDVGERCVSATTNPAGMLVTLVSTTDESVIAEFPVEQARLEALVPSNPGYRPPLSVEWVHIVDDSVVAYLSGSPARLCRLSVREGAVAACTPMVPWARLEFADAHRLCISSDAGYGCVDPTTLAPIGQRWTGGWVDEVASDASTLSVVVGREQTVLDANTFQPIGPTFTSSDAIALGSNGRFVAISGKDVRFFDRARETGHATLARTVSGSFTDHYNRRTAPEYRVYDDGLDILSQLDGLLTVEPGDVDADFTGPWKRRDAARFGADGRIVFFGFESLLTVGPEGIVSTPREDSDPEEEPVVDPSRPNIDVDFPDHDLADAIAIAPPGLRGIDYAWVDGAVLRITDRRRRDAVRPIRLPAEVRESGCDQLRFVSDVSVALFGSPPCIPTRIDFRARRTEPLGEAYVDVDRTRDGRRVALMANRGLKILDGATGAVLVDLAPTLTHLRDVRITDDGRRAILEGTEGFAVFDFGDLDASAVRTEPRSAMFSGDWPQGINVDGTRVFGCRDGALVLADPFDLDHPTTIPVPACRIDLSTPGREIVEGSAPDWHIDSNYLVGRSYDLVSVVRLRDHAVLSIEGFASSDRVALALVEMDATTGDLRVRGVHPDHSPLLSFRDPTTHERIAMPTSAGEVERLVREFYAAP